MHEGPDDHIHLDDEGAIAYTGERIELTKRRGGHRLVHQPPIFSDLVLERQGKRLSSRYIVTQRSIRSRSEVILTPFNPAGQIDAMRWARSLPNPVPGRRALGIEPTLHRTGPAAGFEDAPQGGR